MKFLPTRVKALTLATLCLATVSTAQAIPTFDASMAVELKLTDVTDDQSTPSPTGWSATAEGSIFNPDIVLVGDATGDNSFTLSPLVTLGINGVFAEQATQAFGSATNGTSQVFMETNLRLRLENSSAVPLTFFFDVISFSDVSVSGESPPEATASTYGLVQLWTGSFSLIETLDSVFEGSPFLPGSATNSFSVNVGAGSRVSRIVTVDSYGEAFASPIPAPASIALLVPGFFGLLAARRRKQS